MVWGCVAHNGAGNLAFIDNKMNVLAYIDVLRHHFLDNAKKFSTHMKNTFIFQQDNDPKHTAFVTKTWLLYHASRRHETPLQSPLLNLIENLWMHLYTEVRKKNVTSKENLKEKLQEVWNSIETKKLIESMSRRLEAVIKANGLLTNALLVEWLRQQKNCRIWSEANPQVYCDTPLHPEKRTVWCALWAGGIIAPYFFKNDEGHNVTVNSDRYRGMITNFFIPELNKHDVQESWFQQDGATCHTARATIDLLKDTFGDRLISSFGPVNLPQDLVI
ncbi:transposable element Tcb2 transposase [Trichonephila clavipes]|nr:transposable element Tcb2 transposase [Trichonephila clavipes]